jgi:predicted deacylase
MRPIDYAALPAGRHRVAVRVAELPSGRAVELDVVVLVGRRPRPRLAVVAGVHGNEYPGPLAVGRLAGEIDPGELDGTVVFVPVANPLAFDAGARNTPDDGVNLNRVFPGAPDGTITQQIAHALVDGIVQDADLALDLHSATAEGVMLPMAGFRAPPPSADQRAVAVARASAVAAAACGLEMYWLMQWAPGTLSTALNARGVPAVGAEVGGQGAASEREVALYAEAARRAIHHLGLLGPPLAVELPRQAATMEDVPASASGLLELAVGLGDETAAGDLLGRVVDLWGDELAELRAPFAGRVVHLRTFRQVRAGDTVLSLSRGVPNPVVR